MLELINQSIDHKKIRYALSVKDMKTGEVYNHNENIMIPSASTIKILIMAEAFNQVKKELLTLEQRISVKKEDKVPFSILSMLETGNTYSLRDVIILMIVQSDNTATNILIDLLGTDNINRLIKEINLKNTILQRKMMDFSARKLGRDNFTSSGDMASLMEMIYKGELVDRESCEKMIEIMKLQLDRTMIYSEIPDDVVTAHKTGELDNLDHEVGIFYTKEKDYIFAMLTYEAESNNYARKTVGTAAKIVYDYLNGRNK